ncbi:MAG: YfiM family protein [Desulfobacula sp.]|nr:YfiM family protein [Desulfobacula sp.]
MMKYRGSAWPAFNGFVLPVLVCLFFLLPLPASADEDTLSKEQKLTLTHAAAFSVVTAWGIANWDYFDRDPHRESEGWFSKSTDEGGADKLGHFYLSHLLTRIMAQTYESWGYLKKDGALYGALSSFGIMTWMELGDSFSEYGFSHEDFIMNALGSLAGYFLHTNPALSDIIDFRFEYRPRFDELDIFTDYEHSKFLMAVKLDGFDGIKNNYLKYMEFHLGYYVRNLSSHEKERNVYVAIGLNLSKIFKNLSMDRMSTLTRYIQIPYTYAGMDLK